MFFLRKKIFKTALFSTAIIAFHVAVFSQSFDDGLDAYRHKKYKPALEIWEVLAESGDPDAQLWMGVTYMLGKGVSKDYSSAYFWIYLAQAYYPYESDRLIQLMLPYMNENQINLALDRAQNWKVLTVNSEIAVEAIIYGNSDIQEKIGSLYFAGSEECDYFKAAGWLLKSAEKGNEEAQFKLGFLYDAAMGLPEDDQKALYWYRKAAAGGEENALIMIGLLFIDGKHIPHHLDTGIKYLRRVAEKGNSLAQLLLGEILINLDGLPIDTREGMKWLLISADQGDPDAQNLLGIVHSQGRGIDPNPQRAAEWFLRAASQNHPEAQYNLGVIYNQNRGSPHNITEAVKWYQKAAQHNISEAHLAMAEIYMSGIQLRNDCRKAYYWATLAAAGNNKKVKGSARKIMEKLRQKMSFPDLISAQNEALDYWLEINPQ